MKNYSNTPIHTVLEYSSLPVAPPIYGPANYASIITGAIFTF